MSLVELLHNDPDQLENLLNLLIRYQYDVPSEVRKEILALISE